MMGLSVASLIPGGIRPTDHRHRGTNDGTCSRCRKDTEASVPLMLWSNDGNDLYIFCEDCTGPDAHAAQATLVPSDKP